MPATILDAPLSELEAELRRQDFGAFNAATYPDLTPGWHLDELCWELQEFAHAILRGESPRLIVEMPPRHTKSTTASQRFPVWCMARWGWDVLFSSYGQELADEQSLKAIEVADSDVTRATFPHTVRHADPAARRTSATDRIRRWNMRGVDGRLGTYACAGIEGAFTGKGAKLFICDDPHKNREDAQSEIKRRRVKSFYTSVASTRMDPGGGILVIQTRWHCDDLAGWLQDEAKRGGEKWRVVSFPAIAERDEVSRRDGTLLRRTGEALHPARYPLERLRQIEAIDPREFAALYQQRPIPAEGGLIKPRHLQHTYTPVVWVGVRTPGRVSPASPLLRVPGAATARLRIVSADTATKAGELNDYTAIGSAIEIGQQLALADVVRRRLEFPELCDLLHSICERDDPNVVLIEDKGSGQQLIQQLKRRPGWRWSIVPVVPTVDKETRMSTETPWLEAGRLLLPESAPWRPDFDTELLQFPAAAHDDQVDMLSQLLAYMRERSAHDLRALFRA